MESWENNAGNDMAGGMLLSMLLTLTGFYLPEQPAEAQKAYRKRDVSTERQRETKSQKKGLAKHVRATSTQHNLDPVEERY